MAHPGPPQLWNHRVHQRWAGQDLTFWRLVFFPRYDREKIIEVIESVLDEEGVRAFAIYEAMGLFDLFLRAWLPSQSSDRLEHRLKEALEAESLQLLDSFSTTRVLRHHAWETGKNSRLEPEESVLNNPLADDIIERLNRGEVPSDEQQELLDKRILAPLHPGRGVQFLTVISSAIFSMTNEVHTTLREGLLKRVRESGIHEPAVYEGTGFGEYIVTGRAAEDGLHTITDLSTAINELALEEGVAARPYTHICAHRLPLFYADNLPLKQDDLPVDMGELLRHDESRTLEVMPALGEDLTHWLGDDKEAIPSETLIDNGLIKTIVGMLNADGGQLVLGAIHCDAELVGVRAADHPKLRDLPMRGDYICVGVNREYGEGGWEEFKATLNALVSTKIQPPPLGSISVACNAIEDGVDVWVISVRPTRATWFYRVLSDSGPINFFVREGARTVSYAGVEADIYKRERPRG